MMYVFLAMRHSLTQKKDSSSFRVDSGLPTLLSHAQL
jgi:hypothetical protein